MGRLIDADELYKSLIESIDWLKDQDYETYSAVGDNIRFVIDQLSTAYDLDKVVELLEAEMQKAKEEVEKGRGLLIKEPYTPYVKAIEIVKGGGVDA